MEKPNKEIRVTKDVKVNLNLYSYVKCTRTKHSLRATLMKYKPLGGLYHTKKLSNNQYIDTRTGEVFDYTHHTNDEYYNQQKWRKKYDNLSLLTENNFEGNNNELYITLTYGGDSAGCMTDFKKAQTDFKSFIERLLYHYSNCEYLAIPEPNDTGCWHIHMLLKRPGNKSLYIPNERINKLWKQGLTETLRLYDACNLGKYHVGSFSKESTESGIDNKAIAKGGRIQFYPPNIRFPWKSKGILDPESIIMTGKELHELVGDTEPSFSEQIEILDEQERVIREIYKQKYPSIRLSKYKKNLL